MNVVECLKEKNHMVKAKDKDPFKVTFYNSCKELKEDMISNSRTKWSVPEPQAYTDLPEKITL